MLGFIDRHLVTAASLLLFATAQFADVVTTLFIYRDERLQEVNPATSALLAHYGPLVYLVVKLLFAVFMAGLVMLTAYAGQRLERPWLRTLGRVALGAVIVWTAFVVGSNLYHLHEIQVI
jgi:hypothetical protein